MGGVGAMPSGRLQMVVYCAKMLQHVFWLILQYLLHFIHMHEAHEG